MNHILQPIFEYLFDFQKFSLRKLKVFRCEYWKFGWILIKKINPYNQNKDTCFINVMGNCFSGDLLGMNILLHWWSYVGMEILRRKEELLLSVVLSLSLIVYLVNLEEKEKKFTWCRRFSSWWRASPLVEHEEISYGDLEEEQRLTWWRLFSSLVALSRISLCISYISNPRW